MSAVRVLPDVQEEEDTRGVLLNEVGIAGLSYPVTVLGPDGTTQSTVAEAEMTVSLAESVRGTHMSRFVEVLHDARETIGPSACLALARTLRDRLDAEEARVRLDLPLFVERRAPVSDQRSLMRVDCRLEARSGTDERVVIGVSVPVTSLCPCSKEISDYGAHSQRGRVDIEIDDAAWSQGRPGIWPEELVAIADQAASAPIFPLLKRVDERHVTMAAYDKPAFVEDLARDTAVALREDPRVAAFSVAVSNAESIHDHEAVARLRWSRT